MVTDNYHLQTAKKAQQTSDEFKMVSRVRSWGVITVSVLSLPAPRNLSHLPRPGTGDTPPLTYVETWVLGHEVVLTISEVVYK